MVHLDHVIVLFPAQARSIRQLYLREEQFRSICEDLDLALTSLDQIANRGDARADDVAELQELRDGLGRELLSYVDRAEAGG